MYKRKTRKGWLGTVVVVAMLLALLSTVFLAAPVSAAGTQSVTVTRLANDGVTVLGQVTVTYTEMMSGAYGLPVLGDGTTHYYHQGPVFIDDPDEATEQMLRWNAAEDTNVDTKDMGALRGTNLKDLCDLVGGMAPGEQLKVKAIDNMSKMFAYTNVYEYSSREGPMVLAWEQDGKYPNTGYNDGMRLVWFADDSTNPWGIHAFGNWDWHEAASSEYWYYYMSGGESYPTTTGLSVKYVSQLIIYSNDPPPPVAAFTSDVQTGIVPLTVNFTDNSTNSPTSWAWDFDNNGTVDSAVRNPTYIYTTAGTYTVKLTATNAGGSDDEVKTDYISVIVDPAAPIPETPTALLVGMGLLAVGGLLWVYRRREKSHQTT